MEMSQVDVNNIEEASIGGITMGQWLRSPLRRSCKGSKSLAKLGKALNKYREKQGCYGGTGAAGQRKN
jgi:hypothetical protein